MSQQKLSPLLENDLLNVLTKTPDRRNYLVGCHVPPSAASLAALLV